MRRIPLLLLCVLGHAGFLAVMVCAMLFLAGVSWLPRTVDAPVHLSTPAALVVNAALLLLFAVQHSVMARGRVKAAMRRWVPAEIERTVYVLATELCPVLLLAWWQPMHGRVWWVDGPAAVVLWGLCVTG